MKWTRPHDLRAQVQKLWDRGELLASLVTGEPLFPKRLALKTPTSTEISDRFEEVRAWIGELREFPKYRLEMRDFRHRLFGANSIPQAVWIDTIEDALLLIGKSRAAGRFSELIAVTREFEPRLLSWLAKRPVRTLELDDEWRRLLEIVAWIEKNPAPGVYFRQVDIPGVHTKFIETYRGVLAELFDIVLPPEAIDSTASGTGKFAKRYGFRDKPDRIRFRVLDPQCAILPCGLGQDITLDAESFARLDPKVSRVFITENEINFLAFPQVRKSLVIFGAGYGFEMLSRADWLKRCRILYWGDIDTHGFAILDQLRSHIDNVESFLMDHATLLAFESQWGKEEKQTLRDLPRLTGEEKALFDDLRDNRIRGNLRLEQERVGLGWVESALSVLFKSCDSWK
jgi:hypothetical protein